MENHPSAMGDRLVKAGEEGAYALRIIDRIFY